MLTKFYSGKLNKIQIIYSYFYLKLALELLINTSLYNLTAKSDHEVHKIPTDTQFNDTPYK